LLATLTDILQTLNQLTYDHTNTQKLETSHVDIEYKIIKPDSALSDFVERFYLVINNSAIDKEMIVIPDGRIDIFFLLSDEESLGATLLGLETQPSTVTFSAKTKFFGISFNLLAVEYVLNISIADILNTATQLPPDFWGITKDDLSNFEDCCNKVSIKIKELIKPNIDTRKQKLFNLVYSTNGSLTIKEYAEKVFWSSRQINRYFNQTFGLPLKLYCKILRFRATFKQIKDGKLYPERYFSDQAHFIREVKRLTGVVPKELSKNKNDRVVQFSTLTKE